jgi:hypothetical protein
MATFVIRKTEKSANLKRATARMDWKGFVIAGTQKIKNKLFQDNFPADLEVVIDDGDLVIEVDTDGKEIARATF